MESSKAEYQKDEFVAGIPQAPEGEFCVFGIVYAHPEHADALEAIYAETTRLAASEPGSLHYCICRDSEDPTIFHFFERYTGRAAFDEHNAQPIIQKMIKDNMFKGVKARFVEAIKPASS